MSHPIYALIDCNNFFVSCERIFRPDLEGKPVVVLSSNDGCAVARSNEAKRLGIPMGAPAFKYRSLFKQHGVISFSANFELYADISRRITQILTEVTPRIEIYSIDESFLDLSALAITDYTAWAQAIRQRVWHEVGVPVAIGIAPTKTLAKLAAEHAKHHNPTASVLSLQGLTLLQDLILQRCLREVAIEEVWGIGWRMAPKLRALGLSTAYDVSRLSPQLAQQLMGIHGRQLVSELNGISCYGLELEGRLPQSIARTRTFGEDTNQAHVIEAAFASFVTQAAYRLRRSGQLTRQMGLFITTSRHKPNYKSWSEHMAFTVPTADSGQLITAAIQTFQGIYSRMYSYHRAGIWLYDFVPAHQLQTDLFGTVDLAGHERAKARMSALDSVNKRYGKHTMRFAAEDLAKSWQPQQRLRSPRYVSNWDELPKVKPL
jgi:DNA polymerase V